MAARRIVAGVCAVFALALAGALAGPARAQDGSLRARAQVAEAKSQIASLKIAIASYRMQTGRYPGASADAPKDDPDVLFRALYTGNPKLGGSRESHLEDWPVEDIGRWPGSFKAAGEAYERPAEGELDFTTASAYQPLAFLDPWGRPFHYVEWDSFRPADRKLGDDLVAGAAHEYAIWSNGPNGENEWGEGDDIASWKP